MARWVRRMEQLEPATARAQFEEYLERLKATRPSRFRVLRLKRMLQKHHVVIGRGMFSLLSAHDRFYCGSSVRRAMLDEWGDGRP